MTKLAINDLTVRYGKLTALDDLSFAVEEGARVFISGPNGAGKSSLLKAIAGVAPTAHGRIEMDGDILNGASPESIARKGLSMVPEGREVFGQLTIEENLMIGTGIRRDRSAVAEDLWEIYNAFPILGERRHANAGALSGGQQQMLVIGRALMTNPKLMMIDEPSLGLAPKIVDQVYDTLLELQALKGLTLLIVEQSSARAARVGGRMILMRGGRIVGDGDAAELGAEDSLRDAYFGQSKPVKEAS
ncbi:MULTISPECIES: ABC transporter ATP-binding protein [Roseobacteraceae]|jgi:branched-chain amino acid transport system ATP-binding protein|uniref:ABC transporter ATP-binding protein n=3 Tax=Rhodobacterales TaxID=204455 RepID=UPI0007C228D0|nr:MULTISPECIES: ABC transporter ATP-binding protein [unclassified Sulfitobacter]KZY05032.1 ABC transporter ATP-binding protein [Sulfitobacter sp. HI0023]KZY49143.1 ABC transporter ATP-binding protein [Sulfitobacter sp. HI0054]KZZ68419.1 ABC transporter ATP-binding protein [Sulfitobacter sp. HI0129]MEC9312900.1 ABC transporter ATP-binding protein [Pseudomonadota bacterium]